MAFTFSDLRSEVKRRATRDQGGTQFDTGINNVINTSIWRIAREARWRNLRRTSFFNTVKKYTTGSGAVTVTNNSASVTATGATLLTDGVIIGRYVKFSGSAKYFKIRTITGQTTFTIDQVYDGTTSSTATYSILGQEDYVLPIQVGHSAFLWHKQYGFPLPLTYMPTQTFYESGAFDTVENIPVAYRMWGADDAITQVKTSGTISLSSSSSSDTSVSVTIFGIVSGYPDYEIVVTNSTNGTTAAVSTKSFSSIDRISKNQATVGRITLTMDSGLTTIAVLPVGSTTSEIKYSRVQLYPLPNATFPINVYYYKLPYQLVNDADVSELGEEFSEAIILLSTAKLKAEQSQQESALFYQMYDDEIKSLRKTNVDKIDWLPKLKRPVSTGFQSPGGGVLYQQVGAFYGPPSM